MTNLRGRVGGIFAAGLLLASGGVFAAESDVPRYWLKVGQELTYRTTSEFSTADGNAVSSESTWQVWVVKQNADGGWRLILRHAASFPPPTKAPKAPATKNQPGKSSPAKPGQGKPTPGKAAPKAAAPSQAAKPAATKPAERAPAVENVMPREQVTFAYGDLSPDGSILQNSTLGFQFDPRPLLPKLPKGKAQLDKGWTDSSPETQITYRYQLKTPPGENDDQPTWAFIATRQSPVDDVYLSRSQSTYVFNGDRGLVERIETKLDQGYPFKGSGVATTELADVEQFDAAWCKKLDEEMGHYFGVQRRYQSMLQAAQRNSIEAETLLVEAGALLQKAAADMTLPVVKEDLGKQVAQHAGMIGLTARAARDRADLIDQTAPTWQTKDLQGNAHALRDYKGKVVVLHFWRRGDGWSLRLLPQIEQLAEEFTDKPVAVLGMNADSSEEDARFVADRMGLAYPILRAEKFAEKYNGAAVSELVIIDQKGVVRDVFVGYSPSTRDDVSKVISGLLKEKD